MEADKTRRKFIQASLIVPLAATLPTAAGATSGRLHGTPASKAPLAGAALSAERMVLPLAEAGIPAEALTDLSHVSTLVESVLTDDKAAGEFFASPSKYFEAHGLDGTDSTLVDISVRMLVALTEPSVKNALVQRNYSELFACLEVAGVFEPRSPSELQSRVQQLISNNLTEIKRAIDERSKTPMTPAEQSELFEILRESGALNAEDELAAVARVLNSNNGEVTIAACSAMAACVVGIALMAALYVSVAIAATVAVLAGVTVSAAVMTAVFVKGGEVAQGFSAPFTGQFMRLDPAAVRNIQRAYKVAAVTQDGQMQLHALRGLIREEVEAVLVSLSNLQLISIDRETMPRAVDAVAHYACRSAGISTDQSD